MKKINITIKAPNQRDLDGNIFSPENLKDKTPAFLFIHGWQSSQDRGFLLSEKLVERGYIAMTFDLPGHGKSHGDIKKLSRKDFLLDTVRVYDFLVEQEFVDSNNMIVFGSSFGGYITSLLSEKRKISKIALRVPANYKDEYFSEPVYEFRKSSEHLFWKNSIQKNTQTFSLQAVANFDGKVLIVESELDEQVPHEVVQSYVNSAKVENLTYFLMEGAPHSITRSPKFQEEFSQIVINWLEV